LRFTTLAGLFVSGEQAAVQIRLKTAAKIPAQSTAQLRKMKINVVRGCHLPSISGSADALSGKVEMRATGKTSDAARLNFSEALSQSVMSR